MKQDNKNECAPINLTNVFCFLLMIKVSQFLQITCNSKTFQAHFATTIDDAYMKAGNCKNFSGNEGKDVKQQTSLP